MNEKMVEGEMSSENGQDNAEPINEQLARLGGDLSEINRVKRRYPMKITKYYFGLIKEKDDPIWKQCVPSQEELEDMFNVEDPLKEEDYSPVPCVVHKYPDRVLLLVSSVCAMYCRFCTRRRKVGRIRQILMEDIFRAIDYIQEHPEVRDVLVSGGDPLMRSDRDLEIILGRLKTISHVEIIRIGTRIPCVLPSRVTPRLANMIKKFHPVFMNIHFNHPCEITEDSAKACSVLANAGIPLGCQTVLLRGVNDTPEIMKQLVRELIRIRVKPYYIYQCDMVKGVEHFRTPIETGIQIMKQLQGYTTGLCLPHYVIDGPGGKVPVSPQYVKEITPDQILVTNYLDNLYTYPGLRNRVTPGLANKKVSRIGIAFNLKRVAGKGEQFDKYAEFDDVDTINAIRKAIESAGYETELLEADQDFIERVKASAVDFVFNIAEGIQGESRESHVPAILEMLKIPYSGSGVLTQAITLNKSRKKEILDHYGIPTPAFQLFKNAHQKLDPDLKFPLIVKPDAEGSSKGITNSSLVLDMASLRKQVSHVTRNYDQMALVEEFCPGREFTVGILGNKKPRVLPIVEITFDHLPPDLYKFDSYEAKWIYDSPERKVDPLVCPAMLKPRLKSQLEKLARQTYDVLGCVDVGRIDFKLDAEGVPNVLDVNALPGLIPDPDSNSRFPKACYAAGMSYDEMIMAIIHSALRRYNLLL